MSKGEYMDVKENIGNENGNNADVGISKEELPVVEIQQEFKEIVPKINEGSAQGQAVSVSDGDSFEFEEFEIGLGQESVLLNEGISDIASYTELVLINEKMDDILGYLENENMSIWEKPLEKYNTQESLGLILLFVLLAVVIFKIVGGIIRCEI